MAARSDRNWNSVVIPERVRERAFTKWMPSSDCWISTYSTASHGYAQIGWQNGGKRHVVLAHKAAWEHVNGPVPVGMTVDHLCWEKKCVNPAHLRVLPNFENARRTKGRDWPLGQCANGHPNSALREVSRGNGKKGRKCGICIAESRKRYNEKKRKAAAK